MSKKNVMISVDEFIHAKIKEKGLNVSEVCNKALRDRTDEKEALANSTIHVCTECNKEIESGYFCPEHKKIFCDDCQDKWDFRKCEHDIKDGVGESRLHFHNRFGIIKQCFGQTLKDIEKNNNSKILT